VSDIFIVRWWCFYSVASFRTLDSKTFKPKHFPTLDEILVNRRQQFSTPFNVGE